MGLFVEGFGCGMVSCGIKHSRIRMIPFSCYELENLLLANVTAVRLETWTLNIFKSSSSLVALFGYVTSWKTGLLF